MANVVEKIFRLIMDLGNSEKDTQKVTQTIGKLSAEVSSAVKAAEQFTGTFSENSQQLAAYKQEMAQNSKSMEEWTEYARIGAKQADKAAVEIERLATSNATLKVAAADVNQILTAQAKAMIAPVGSAEELSKNLELLRISYRKMTDEEKASPMGVQTLAAIEQADPALKQFDATIGNNQRNIGAYGTVLTRLGQIIPGTRQGMTSLSAVFRLQQQFEKEGIKNVPILSSLTRAWGNANTWLATTFNISAASANLLMGVLTLGLAPAIGWIIDKARALSTMLGNVKADAAAKEFDKFTKSIEDNNYAIELNSRMLKAQGASAIAVIANERRMTREAQEQAYQRIQVISAEVKALQSKWKWWFSGDRKLLKEKQRELDELVKIEQDYQTRINRLNDDADVQMEQDRTDAAKKWAATSKKKIADEKKLLEAYEAYRKAQAVDIVQYDLDHQEAEVQALEDSLNKKIQLNNIATERALFAAQKEHDGKIEQLNKQQEANKHDAEKVAAIEADKTALIEKYDQKATDIRDSGTKKHTDILRNATMDELKEYAKLPGAASEAEAAITEALKRELDKRRKLVEESLAQAKQQYLLNEGIADATLGADPKDNKRKAAKLKNEIELREAQAQTYRQDLEWMLKNGLERDALFGQTLANLAEVQNEVENLAKGLNADGSGGGFKGWLMRTFELKPEEIEQLEQQAWELATQLGNAMIDAQKQASQRRLNAEKKAIEAQYNVESKLLDSKREKGLISEKKYRKELEKLEADKAEKEEAAERVAFEREKKLNIKQALMNTALSIAKTFAEWGWPMGIPFAAIAAAQGAIQVATISSQKYAQGGLIPIGEKMGVVKGRSHAQGGHQIYIDGRPIGEIEGDELLAIVNKRDTARIGALSAANSVNGRKFAQGGLVAPKTGYMTSSVSAPVSVSQLNNRRMEEQEGLLSKQDAVHQLLLENLQATNDHLRATNDRIDRIKVYLLTQDVNEAQALLKKTEMKQSW